MHVWNFSTKIGSFCESATQCTPVAPEVDDQVSLKVDEKLSMNTSKKTNNRKQISRPQVQSNFLRSTFGYCCKEAPT